MNSWVPYNMSPTLSKHFLPTACKAQTAQYGNDLVILVLQFSRLTNTRENKSSSSHGSSFHPDTFLLFSRRECAVLGTRVSIIFHALFVREEKNPFHIDTCGTLHHLGLYFCDMTFIHTASDPMPT